MLTIFHEGVGYPIPNDTYYVRELSSGLNEVVFEISIRADVFPYIVEEASILDRDLNYYLVKQIDMGLDTAKVVCQIDVDEWKSELFMNYSNNSATVYNTISSVKPDGWNVIDNSLLTMRRTIPTGDTKDYNVTAWEIIEECMNVYNVRVLIDNHKRVLRIINPNNYEPLGAFATKELNLKELNFKGKSQGFATRLYAYGKDDLSFADINDGKPYVDDNTYSNRVICAYWKDDRYTVKENLLTDARKKLHDMATPQRSYDCDVIDLQSTNPEMYGHQNFDLFQVVTLMDSSHKTAVNHQVVERWNYPHYPINNKVILSTQVPKIQSQITQLTNSINNPVSTFQQIMNAIIQSQTEAITGQEGGYVVLRDRDGDGKPDEILIMDTEDIATAVNVIRFNNAGMGFSTNGYNGPYRNAWTIDGQFTADNITGGTMSAGTIRGIDIIGSVLTFGDDPNTVTLRTNDDKNGGIIEGTGNIYFSTSGQYKATNYFADKETNANILLFNSTGSTSNQFSLTNYKTSGDNANYITATHYYGTTSDRNALHIANVDYDGTTVANYLLLTSSKNDSGQSSRSNTLALYNNTKSGRGANYLSFGHNPATNYNDIRIANYQINSPSIFGNTLYWYTTASGNYFYFENYQLSSSQMISNQLLFSGTSTSDSVTLTNREYGSSSRNANVITMNSYSNGSKNQMIFTNYQRGSTTRNSIITMDDNITYQCQNWHNFSFLGNDRQVRFTGCTHFYINGVDLVGQLGIPRQ